MVRMTRNYSQSLGCPLLSKTSIHVCVHYYDTNKDKKVQQRSGTKNYPLHPTVQERDDPSGSHVTAAVLAL